MDHVLLRARDSPILILKAAAANCLVPMLARAVDMINIPRDYHCSYFYAPKVYKCFALGIKPATAN